MTLRFAREPKGYGMLGVSWAFTAAGRSVIVCFGRCQIRYFGRNRDFELLVQDVAARESEGAEG